MTPRKGNGWLKFKYFVRKNLSFLTIRHFKLQGNFHSSYFHSLKLKLLIRKSLKTLLLKDDFITSFDLENMYFHVKLHPDSVKYFGFCVPDIQGNPVYYQFLVMCYGYKRAVEVVTRLTKPLKAWIHDQGIRASLYLDDNLTMGQGYYECKFKFKLVLHVFQLAGWKIQWKKTICEPKQKLQHLGFILDSVNLKYWAVEEKLYLLEKVLDDLLIRITFKQPIEARHLAGVLGKIQALKRSHGSIVSILSRASQHKLGKEVLERGWETLIELNKDCFNELIFLKQQLFVTNGQFIRNSLSAGKIIELEEVKKIVEIISNTSEKVDNLFVSDASESSAFIFYSGDFHLVNDFEFDNFEKNTSSGHRELLAVVKTLENEENEEVFKNLKSRRIYWQTDSKNNFIFMSRGSKKPDIQRDVIKFKLLEKKLDLEVIPVWTSRNHERIILADLGSKFSQSSDEWGIQREILNSLFTVMEFCPSVDCFASSNNKICEKFFSKIPQIATSGVNFFCQKLDERENYFCCPPTKLINFTFKHLTQQTIHITALLVVPVWKSSAFWPLIFQGNKFHPNIVKHLFFNGRFLSFNKVDTLFSRTNSLEMVALLIKT